MVEITSSGLLFDLDGVLIDSTPAVTRVWTAWALNHGFDPEDTVRRAHGRPSLSTIKEFLPGADHEAENRVVESGEINDTDGVIPLPGARELLSSLPDDRWGVVTSCTRALAEVRLKAAGLPIPVRLLTADDVQNGKPDPEPYQRGAAMLGINPGNCVVFEDAPAGIRSGKAAGASVIAVRTTASDAELEQAGPDWIVTGCNNVRLTSWDGGFLSLALDSTEAKSLEKRSNL
jgi:sugar-phosphatase